MATSTQDLPNLSTTETKKCVGRKRQHELRQEVGEKEKSSFTNNFTLFDKEEKGSLP
jgi:hypothetical protein